MSMEFRALAEQARADGAITADEVLALRHGGWDDGRIDADEADAIFVLNEHLKHASSEWCAFFVEAISEFIVNGAEPKGYVSDDMALWLSDHVDRDGRLDSVNELELLVRIFEKAVNVPVEMKNYALAQIEVAVLTGEGPTRDGGSLDPGCISEAETHLLRRMIFAAGGDRPAAVSRAEAELLFRLKDATLGQPNSAEWQRLFVQGVGNYLQGFGGEEQLSRERAAELEVFMSNTAVSIGGFFGRMFGHAARSGVGDGLEAMSAEAEPPRHYDLEAADAAEVTALEKEWLQGQLDADGNLDELEKALLDFLAEEDGQ